MNDFYQSPADKMRLDVLLNSLLEGRLNLAILGHDEIALAHYARTIHEHLRQHGQQVELWSSAESDQLVDRFNRILADLTLKQAQDKVQTSAQRLYLIFPDTHAIADFELQLLARLVNGFPASNINVILIINRLEPFERKLQAFGKNLLQWILESEHPIPDRMTQIEVKSEEPTPQAAPRIPDLDELEPPEPAAEGPNWSTSSHSSQAIERKRINTKKGLGLVFLALLISAAVFFAMKWKSSARQDSPEPAANSATAAATSPATEASSTANDSSSPAPALGMSSSANQPVPAQESLTAGKEELISGKPNPTPSPAPAASQPAQALDALEEAKAVLNASTSKEGMRILMAPRNGGTKHYFIVVRGPFDTKESAESIMKTDAAFAKAWMRSAKSMKTQFDKP